MSGAAAAPRDGDRPDRYPRYLEGHRTQTIERTAPIDHGYRGTWVQDDTHRDPPANAPEYSFVPDGGLYQNLRSTWLTAQQNEDEADFVEINDGRKTRTYLVLSRDYQPNWWPGEQRLAVTLYSSNWDKGLGEDDDYSPLWKYTVKCWPVDADGNIQTGRDLLYSLSAMVMPQYEYLDGDRVVYPDGTEWSPPYGDGTKVDVNTTWVERPEQAFTRFHDVIRKTLGYSIDATDIIEESKQNLKQEAHVRLHKEKAQDLKHALQQSADLIPHKNGDIENYDGEAHNGTWELFRFQSSDWDLIGGRDTGNVHIGIKIYFTADPENARGAFQHPKCEAWLADTKTGQVPWDAYDDMQQVLEELVISHLEHAGVREEHLIEDDMFKPSERPTREMEYTNERREWLRDHYQSLEPSVYHEAMREQTTLPYDILAYLVQHGTADYDELATATGAARRTIREHVRRLEQDVGGESPGIIQRIRSSKTVITFTNEMYRVARDALEKVRPDDTPEDREERKAEREQAREERADRDDLEDDRDDDLDVDHDRPDWRRLDTLAAGFEAVRRLPENAVRVNIRHPNWRTEPGG